MRPKVNYIDRSAYGTKAYNCIAFALGMSGWQGNLFSFPKDQRPIVVNDTRVTIVREPTDSRVGYCSDNPMGTLLALKDLDGLIARYLPGYKVVQKSPNIDEDAPELNGKSLVAFYSGNSAAGFGRGHYHNGIVHAARKDSDWPYWKSKMDTKSLIGHDRLSQLEGPLYGKVFAILAK